MKIGILSDSHDRHDNVSLALRLLRDLGAELLLHCGDITSVETIQLFEGEDVHFVFGNCDYDTRLLRGAIADVGAKVYEPFGSLELEGRKIAWIHSHDQKLFRKLEHGGEYDFLFYGHTHEAEQHVTGSTTVINPGALHRAVPYSCGVLDLETGEWESIRI